jgi:XTP/dITP diphosphohydrolase
VGTVLVATRSQGKLRELRPLFSARGIGTTDLDEACVAETPEEDSLEAFATFEENALAKAKYFHSLTGLPTAADDSGICVVALNGEPGVHSKRWSGRRDLSGQALDDENNRLLLERMAGTDDRRAYYVCVAAYVDGARTLVQRGEVHGRIIETPSGENGFGYDPYFFATELGMTFGDATRIDKERVSHRGRAFDALVKSLAL